MPKDHSVKRRAMMIGSLISATVKYARAGFKTRTKAEQKEVIMICEQCDFYRVTKLGPRCGKCGCCLHIKKRWLTANCPISKW